MTWLREEEIERKRESKREDGGSVFLDRTGGQLGSMDDAQETTATLY